MSKWVVAFVTFVDSLSNRNVEVVEVVEVKKATLLSPLDLFCDG